MLDDMVSDTVNDTVNDMLCDLVSDEDLTIITLHYDTKINDE